MHLSGLPTKSSGRLLSYLNVSSKNALALRLGGKSGSGIGAVDTVSLRWNTMVETYLTTEREKSCGEHSCVVRDKRVGIVGMTVYKNMEVDLIYDFQCHSNNL